jgi:CRISPR/Cas system-associated endonuclease/helicase Cas3
MLEARLAFSALVDADYLDTEAHFQGDTSGKHYRASGPALQPEKALLAVLRHLETLAAGTEASEKLRQVRRGLLEDVLHAAESQPGLFSFTAPTGSGKTLAMLAFALKHAALHGLRRVVLAVPYLSILEQTAKVYRQVLEPIFGPGYVLEHHSLAGLGFKDDENLEQERLRRLHSENWDAPVVLTTNVQLLESLFANRPAACRKLHRLAHAAVLFDEAQALPLKLALPTLATLSQLADRAHTSVVFATATQPAYEVLADEVKKAGGLDWRPTEAVASAKKLFARIKRVEPAWALRQGAWELPQLGEELRGQPQALCILNLKRQALELTRLLEGLPGLLHLSTNLCPAHRRAVLEEVRRRLVTGEPCRLVATQCVEAGVDLDFPLVYRALGPLEAIAQAAGRCNREGRQEKGRLWVFEVEGDKGSYPDDAYAQAAAVTRSLLVEKDFGLDLDDPDSFRAYYQRLFNLSQPQALNPDLKQAMKAGDFVEVARQYRLIKNDVINVVVPYGGSNADYDALLNEEAEPGINADWMRRAQALAVGCYRPRLGHPAWGALKPARLKFRRMESDEWFLLNDVPGWSYDALTGLQLPEKDSAPLMIA